MDLGLWGKLAVVTGSSKGIGAAIVHRLAAEGCDCVVVGRGQASLEAMAAKITDETGRRCNVFAADLSSSPAIHALARTWGHADILVNNAGAIPGGRLEDVDEASWRAAWDLKVFGYINLTRAVLPNMGRRRSGVIINIIGAAAQTRDPSYICGVAGNAALTAFTMSLGSDSPRYGVRIVGINPGPVATERLRQLEKSVDSSKTRPFSRAATAQEIASAAAFLASPASGYTSGTILTIDGGLSARSAA